MRKRILMITACIICALLLCVGVFELFFDSGESTFSSAENRMLASKPQFNVAALFDGSYTESIEQYLLDHFPFRDNLITISKEVRQIGSISTYDDYAEIIEIEAEDVQNVEKISDDDIIVTPRPTNTPMPTATLAPFTETPTPEKTVSTEVIVTPEPTNTPDPTPTARPTKEPSQLNDFPSSLSFYTLFNDGKQRNFTHTRSEVYKQCSLFDAYASLLPEDGVFVMTIVPNSNRATRLLAKNNPQGLTSEIEPFIHAMTSNKVTAFSTADLLTEPLLNGEYVYFRSDMHWTPRGAYYAVKKMMSEAGEDILPYDEFPCTKEYPFLGTIYRDSQSKELKKNPDTLDIITPRNTVQVLRYTNKTTFSEIPLIKENANARDRYTVYLGGSAGPWTEVKNSEGNGKSCLLITDSYGLCTIPMFSEVYSTVFYYDPRYYSTKSMGKISELIDKNEITDIFMIVGELHAFDDSFFALCNRHF